MSKTAFIEDDVHEMVKSKQKEIKQKHGIEPRISDIINKILRENIQSFDIGNNN